jgi:hypothetical protein
VVWGVVCGVVVAPGPAALVVIGVGGPIVVGGGVMPGLLEGGTALGTEVCGGGGGGGAAVVRCASTQVVHVKRMNRAVNRSFIGIPFLLSLGLCAGCGYPVNAVG